MQYRICEKAMKKKGYHKIVYNSYQTSDCVVPFHEDNYNVFQEHADF